jgi:hypothetical protein
VEEEDGITLMRVPEEREDDTRYKFTYDGQKLFFNHFYEYIAFPY